jgi:hypothetical protein
MYIRAREQAFRSSNMLNGWKATGLLPLSPITVLEKLQAPQPPQALEPCISTPHHGLDLSLLQSDPPDGTELRVANALCITENENADDVPLSVKRYISRLTRAFEATCSKNATLRKENAEQRELLKIRKNRTTGKRVALKGKFVFSTQEVLKTAREAEKAIANKTSCKRRCKVSIDVENEREQENTLEHVSSDSDSDCIVVMQRR